MVTASIVALYVVAGLVIRQVPDAYFDPTDDGTTTNFPIRALVWLGWPIFLVAVVGYSALWGLGKLVTPKKS